MIGCEKENGYTSFPENVLIENISTSYEEVSTSTIRIDFSNKYGQLKTIRVLNKDDVKTFTVPVNFVFKTRAKLSITKMLEFSIYNEQSRSYDTFLDTICSDTISFLPYMDCSKKAPKKIVSKNFYLESMFLFD